MTVIKRSPYTFKMEQDSMRLTLSTETFESGYVLWPSYTIDGRSYLQELFKFQVPKGCVVIKVVIPTFRGVHISKPIITDADTTRLLANFASASTLLYPRIGVTQNRLYTLKVEDMTMIDSAHGDIRIEWSYDINKSTPTVEDYIED